jgi:hypothetical protein
MLKSSRSCWVSLCQLADVSVKDLPPVCSRTNVMTIVPHVSGRIMRMGFSYNKQHLL